MLYQSQHIQIDSTDGIATLWMAFPGTPVNELTPLRLLELETAIQAVTVSRSPEILVIRSGLPGGFCGGENPAILSHQTDDSAATYYSRIGQRVFGRLADADFVSLAFLEGPCLGPGWELALACDYRIAVAEPDACFGYPRWRAHLPPCWGGHARLHSRARKMLAREPILSPRAAHQCGLLDDLFSRRRAKIELRRWLDQLQARPRKRAASTETLTAALAQERRAFRRALRTPTVQTLLADEVQRRVQCENWERPVNPIPPFPAVVAFLGDDLALMASEMTLRGSTVIALSQNQHIHETISRYLHDSVQHGRANLIERDAAIQRLIVSSDVSQMMKAGLVIVGSRPMDTPAGLIHLPARTVLAVPETHRERYGTRPSQVIGYAMSQHSVQLIPDSSTSADTVHTAVSWFASLGWTVQLTPPAVQSGCRKTGNLQLEAA